MKELSIEQKAKAYDKVYKKIALRFGSNVSEEIFSEFEESEDEKVRKRIIALVRAHSQGMYKDEMLVWLEQKGEQPKKHDVCDNCDQQGSCVSPCPMKLVEKQCEQKTAWSEEDEKYVNDLTAYFTSVVPLIHNEEDTINWLKSLKDRYTWKPNDKQMEVLKEACDKHWEPDGLDPLYTLYQDLKKLKG